jgi:nucleotide-binding universal stress UspA family protein
MSVKLSNICLAIRDSKSCPSAIDLLSKLRSQFNANCLAITSDSTGLSFGQGVEVVKISSEKEAINTIIKSNSDLVIVSITTDLGKQGLITAKDANSLIDKLEGVVLTIPASSSGLNFSSIIVPLDTSSETRQKVPYAVEFAKAFNATIHVIGVSSETGKDAEVLIKNYIRQVSNNIEEKGVRVTTDMRLGGNPTEKILVYAEEKSAGLIAIMTEQETSLASFFKGKYSEQMIKNSEVPVLSIHPKDLIVSEARL